MVPLTIFSWGYWGWGNKAAHFVQAADLVEVSRGFEPLLFADVRIRRSVRAVQFRDKAFSELVGEDRYRWMKGLGNAAVIDSSLGSIAIKNPKEARLLLDLAVECGNTNRRVLFFCACEEPLICHRSEVGRLVLEEARQRHMDIEIVEWPGGTPDVLHEKTSEEVIRKLQRGLKTFPLPDRPDLVKYGGLPWGTIVEASSDYRRLAFLSGPARYSGGRWGLTVLSEPSTAMSQLESLAREFRRSKGYEPRQR